MIPGSPNLEVISKQGSEGAERRRLPRLNLSREQFRLSSNGKIFSVTDLSEGGMAILMLDAKDFELFPLAARIEGTLNLQGEKHSVTAKVSRATNNHVGFEFQGLHIAAKSALQNFLDPERLGAGMKPIPSSERGPLWYHGASGTDLLLWRGMDGHYTKMTLIVLGSFVQWEEETGLITGQAEMTHQEPETWGVVRFETMLLQADASPDVGKLSIAKALLATSPLPSELKKWCLRQL